MMCPVTVCVSVCVGGAVQADDMSRGKLVLHDAVRVSVY